MGILANKEDISNRIMHMYVTDSNYDDYKVDFASSYVATKVYEKLIQLDANKVRDELHNYLICEKDLKTSTRMNRFFENRCHAFLSDGCEINSRILRVEKRKVADEDWKKRQTKEKDSVVEAAEERMKKQRNEERGSFVEKMILEKCSLFDNFTLESVKSLKEKILANNEDNKHYYFQMAYGHTTFDSLFISLNNNQPTDVKLFNMTTGNSHDFNVNETFMQYLDYFFSECQLKTIDFIYVVPELKFKRFIVNKKLVQEKLHQRWDLIEDFIIFKVIEVEHKLIQISSSTSTV